MVNRSPHEQALNVALAATRQFHGVPITYARGATVLTIDRALQGETLKGTIEVGGTEQVVELQEWYVSVPDLLPLAESEPKLGDIITRIIDGVSYVFTVEAMFTGQSHWDWSDTGKTQYLIRTRKDGEKAYEVSKPSGFDISGNEIR